MKTGGAEIIETVKKRRFFLLLGFPAALITLSRVLTEAVIIDLIIYRTCLVSLNFNATDCLMLRTNSGSQEAADLEVKAEPYASTIVMTKTLLENILPGVLSLVFGSWSDRGGRRPLLLAAFSGFASMYAILSFMSDWNISPWYLILALIPANILGGMSTFKLALSCYITDSTTDKNRIVQMTLLDVPMYAGQLFGALAGPYIYKNYGYANVFRTATICCTSALIYTYLWVPESLKDTSKKSIREIHKIFSRKEIFKKSSVGGKDIHRSVICLAIFIQVFNQLIDKGYETTEFLFTRARLGWDVQAYAHFCVVMTVVRATGLCLVSLRSHISGIPDTLLIGIGLITALGGAATRALTWKSWHMYLSPCIEIFAGIVSPIIRSVISKFVPAQDIGKVFSLTALLEMLSFLAGTPLYTFIYSHFLPPIYPSPVYLLSTSLYGLLIICVFCMEIMIRRYREPTSTYIAAAQEDL